MHNYKTNHSYSLQLSVPFRRLHHSLSSKQQQHKTLSFEKNTTG